MEGMEFLPNHSLIKITLDLAKNLFSRNDINKLVGILKVLLSNK